MVVSLHGNFGHLAWLLNYMLRVIISACVGFSKRRKRDKDGSFAFFSWMAVRMKF